MRSLAVPVLAILALTVLALIVAPHGGREGRHVVKEVPVLRGESPQVPVVELGLTTPIEAAQVTTRQVARVDDSAVAPPTGNRLYVLGESAALTLTVYEGARRLPRRMVRLIGVDRTGARSDAHIPQQRAADSAGKVKFIVAADTGFIAQVRYPDGKWSVAVGVAPLAPGSQRMQRLTIPRRRPDARMRLLITSRPSGDSIAGARVTFSWPDRVLDKLDGRTTDLDGVVTVPWAPDLIYHVTASEHSPLDLTAPEWRPASDLACQLNRHARMRGVIDLPRALRRSPTAIVGHVAADFSGRGITSAPLMGDGAWSMNEIEIPTDETTLLALHIRAKMPSYERQIAVRVLLEPGEERVVRDQWESASPLSVRFRYPDGVQVAGGMKVELFHRERLDTIIRAASDSALPAVESTTDNDGVAAFGRMPRGQWSVRIWPGNSRSLGLVATTNKGASGGGAMFNSAANDGAFVSRDLDHDGRTIYPVTLHGFGPIRGHVQRPGGGQRSGISVHFRAGSTVTASAAVSDTTGAFVIHLVPLGADVELLASRFLISFRAGAEQVRRAVTTRAGARHVVLVIDD